MVFTRFSAGPQRTLLWAWSPQCGPELRSCWPGVRRTYGDGAEAEGHAVIGELEPREGEPVVDKYGYGSFHNTMLEDVLRARHVSQIVTVGTVTQICVEETVREGFHRGFEMVMVRDGVSSFDPELHAATLRNIGMKFGRVEPAERLLDLRLRQRRRPASSRPAALSDRGAGASTGRTVQSGWPGIGGVSVP